MGILVPVVEGDGEVEAVPVLIRRLLALRERFEFQVARPKNAHGCGNLTKAGGIERFVELAFRERQCAGVLVLMDTDEKNVCPVEMAKEFTERIRLRGVRHPVAIVLAKREYEAWFLASIETIVGKDINGRPGLPQTVRFDRDVEELRGVKGWISRNLPGTRIYKETEDQAPMTEHIDLSLAASRSRSFQRFCNSIDDLISAIDLKQNTITPEIIHLPSAKNVGIAFNPKRLE